MSLRSDYDRVYRSLSRVELQKGAGDLDLPDLFGSARGAGMLGFYTEEAMRLVFERYGFLRNLADQGYGEVRIEIRCDDPEEHLMRVWSESPRIETAPLLELVARRDVLRPADEVEARIGRSYVAVLNIDWLQLQRPDSEFSDERPPLPGQHYPGLGLGREVLEMTRQAAKRLELDALVTVPSYFHNAFFYSSEFQYVDPHEQGLFLALCRDVLPRTFGSAGAASWAILESMVLDEDSQEPFKWFHDVMLAPISDDLVAYMNADVYHRESGAALRSKQFTVFEAALKRHLAARGIRPLDPALIRRWIADQ